MSKLYNQVRLESENNLVIGYILSEDAILGAQAEVNKYPKQIFVITSVDRNVFTRKHIEESGAFNCTCFATLKEN